MLESGAAERRGTESSFYASRRISIRSAIALVVLLLLLSGAGWLRRQPPPPRDPAPAGDAFSAHAAHRLLAQLFEDQTPHPVGSSEADVVRQRIVSHLEQTGYEVELQEAFVCNPDNRCAMVRNVLARLDGRDDAKPVLLNAHYDSVRAGPGAGDDGSGVAITLEIARILRNAPRGRNPVVFLIDEGEEAGLLGAEAFVQDHPWAKHIGAVVNLESRGTSGPSYLFETSSDNAWLLPLMKSLDRPATSSLFYTIYKRIPNDTNLTVFRRAGMHGVNFAFVGDPLYYHTPLDNLQNLSLATLQQQGDNALAMTRALIETDLASPPAGDAVWFDVLSFFIVWWPEPWSMPLAVTAFMLTAISILLFRRRGVVTAGSLTVGAAWWLASIAASYGVTWLAIRALGALGAIQSLWNGREAPLIVLAWAVALGASTTLALVALRKTNPAGLACGAVLWLSVLAIALAAVLPGVSHLMIVPALVLSAALLAAASDFERRGPIAAAAGLLAAFVVLHTSASILHVAMGFGAIPISAAICAVIVLVVTPSIVPSARFGRLVAAGAWLVAAGGFAVAATGAPWTPATPRHGNLTYYAAAGEQPRWLLSVAGDSVPAEMRRQIEWSEARQRVLPWISRPSHFVASAPAIEGEAPRLEVVASEEIPGQRRRRVRARFDRGLGTFGGGLIFHDAKRLGSIRVNDRTVDRATFDSEEGDLQVWIHARTDEAILVEVELEGDDPLRLTLVGQRRGLPGGVEAPRRPAGSHMVPVGGGDVTIRTAVVQIP
ncbi:MAG TPA: M28 family peptidase [Thermoanaerobaculia bacterium]|nr:M28 family peptidase [Thermoanaerobaculia bacterium]